MVRSSSPRWSLRMLGGTPAAPVTASAAHPPHQHTWQCIVSQTTEKSRLPSSFTTLSEYIHMLFLNSQHLFAEINCRQKLSFYQWDTADDTAGMQDLTPLWFYFASLKFNLGFFIHFFNSQSLRTIYRQKCNIILGCRTIENKCLSLHGL